MNKNRFSFPQCSRRDLLRAGIYGVGVSAAAQPMPLFGQAAAALAPEGKILVVLELSGGNDGLNTLVPYGDDAYYRHRPNLGVPKNEVRKIDEHFGFSGGMAGFEIALDRTDQCRGLHRGDEVKKRCLALSKAERAADLAWRFSVPVWPVTLAASSAAVRLLWMIWKAPA